MLAYIIRRLILAVFILFLTTLLVFFAMRLLPGDPILMLVSSNQAQEYNEEQGSQEGGEPSNLDELERLGKLKDEGYITDQEFEDKKKQLLGE